MGMGRMGLILVGTLVVVVVAGYLVFGRGREIQGVEARKLVANGARLLDVRSPEEFGRGHLPGALNIPVLEIDRRLAEVGPPQTEVVVYCRSGHRSAQAAQALRQHGFTRVHNLGPMTAW